MYVLSASLSCDWRLVFLCSFIVAAYGAEKMPERKHMGRERKEVMGSLNLDN